MIKKYQSSINIFPTPTAAKTETINGVTLKLDKNGVVTISGTANAAVVFSYDLSETITMPTSVSQGGDAYLYFWNSATTNGTVRFFYNDTQRDYWSLGTLNRVLNGFDNLENQTVNRIEIRIPSGTSYNGTISVMLTNNGSQASAFSPCTGLVADVYRKYETATDTITSLPKTIIGDGTALSAWSMKGNMSQSGTPTPSNPVYPQETGDKTANLLDYKVLFSNSFVKETASFKYYRITVTANTQYTLKSNAPASVENVVTTFLYGTSDTMSTANDGLYTDVAKTITSTNDGYVYIAVRKAGTSTTIPSVSETDFDNGTYTIMLNEGSTALPYEPYGYKIPISSNGVSYPIYLSEPLRKIGDVADSINSDGTVTRRIGKVDLGTLQWHLSSSYNGLCDTAISNMRIIGNAATGNAICTSFIEVNANSVTTTNYGFSSCLNSQAKPYINHTGFEGYTDAEFMEFLSGVYMWYVLGTAQTESFTAPSIPTTGTAESFDVDTTLKPSEVSLTYHGWHEHSDEKYVGG